MADEWDVYKVQDADDWGQYAVKEPAPSGGLSNLATMGIGVGAAAGAALALAKSGIPQTGVRAADYMIQGALNIPKVLNTEKSANFAEKVRGTLVQAHKNEVDKFGVKLSELAKANPTRVIDMSDIVGDIQSNPELSKEALSIFKRTPKLDNILQNPRLASEVSLQDAQDILNHLNTKVPKNIRANNLDLIETISSIKAKQLDAFPEMEGIRAEYAKFAQPYNNVKAKFKYNQLLKSIENKFGGAEALRDVEKILPKKLLREMRNYRAGQKLVNTPKALPLVGRLFTFAPFIIQAMDFQRQLERAKEKGGFTIDHQGNIVPLSKEDLSI